MNTFIKVLACATAISVLLSCDTGTNNNELKELKQQEPTLPSSSNIPSSSSMALNVQYLRGGDQTYYGEPIVTVVSSKKEIEKYYEKYETKKLEKYSDSYFANNFLVIVEFWEGSGSIRHEVERIDENGNIVINSLVPTGAITMDMAHWGIIIELNNNDKTKQFKAVIVGGKSLSQCEQPIYEPYNPDPSVLEYCPAEDVAEYPVQDKLPDDWCRTTPLGGCGAEPKLSIEELSFNAQGGVRCITVSMNVGVNKATFDGWQKYDCKVEDEYGWNTYKTHKCPWFTATKVGDRAVSISVDKNETGKERKYYVNIGSLYCWSKVLIIQSAE